MMNKKQIIFSAIYFFFAGQLCAQDVQTVQDTLTAEKTNPYVQCEDTCRHIHGLDLSHYQGNVFWETVGDRTNMTYVYLRPQRAVIASTLPLSGILIWLIVMG